MRICVQVLRKRQHFQQALIEAGWQIVDPTEELIEARHPQVNDEKAARRRLSEIGFLTTPYARVEFRRCQ
jgi:hypothetical protein